MIFVCWFLCSFGFVWCCVLLFCGSVWFCFLLCNSETDHGFSPCHTAKPGTGTVLSKVIFQRPSVWTWSVMACGQKHHWWNDIFLLKHSWQNLEKIDFSYKSPLISGQRNSSAHLSCVFHVQSSSCLHVGLLQHIEQKCKQYLQQVDCYCYGYYARNSAQWSKRHPVKVCLILLPYWHPVLYFSKWGLLSSAIQTNSQVECHFKCLFVWSVGRSVVCLICFGLFGLLCLLCLLCLFVLFCLFVLVCFGLFGLFCLFVCLFVWLVGWLVGSVFGRLFVYVCIFVWEKHVWNEGSGAPNAGRSFSVCIKTFWNMYCFLPLV